jgi:hypothetical protein
MVNSTSEGRLTTKSEGRDEVVIFDELKVYTNHQVIASEHPEKRQDEVPKFKGVWELSFQIPSCERFHVAFDSGTFVMPLLVRVYRDWTLEP